MATKAYVCPECGADMSKLDPNGHSLTHWPSFLDPARSSVEARKRQEQTLAGGIPASEFRLLEKEIE